MWRRENLGDGGRLFGYADLQTYYCAWRAGGSGMGAEFGRRGRAGDRLYFRCAIGRGAADVGDSGRRVSGEWDYGRTERRFGGAGWLGGAGGAGGREAGAVQRIAQRDAGGYRGGGGNCGRGFFRVGGGRFVGGGLFFAQRAGSDRERNGGIAGGGRGFRFGGTSGTGDGAGFRRAAIDRGRRGRGLHGDGGGRSKGCVGRCAVGDSFGGR